MTRVILLEDNALQGRYGVPPDQSALEPREVLAGPYAGKYVVGLGVLADENFQPIRDLLSAAAQVELDPAEAWPVIEEDGEEP